MTMRKIVLAMMLSLGAGALTVPMTSLAAVGIDINIAPPAPRVEAVPAPRVGFVWAPGYWQWRGRRHFWVAGHWMRARRGYHWAPAHWEQRGPHWHFVQGRWAR